MAHKYNPFNNHQNIVYGSRFVGRAEALEAIQERIVEAQEPGSLSIVGLRRIGKSSLAYEALIHQQDALLDRHRIPIWIDMGTLDSATAFFRLMVTKTIDALDEFGTLTADVETAAEKSLDRNLPWSDLTNNVWKFFKRVRRTGWRLVFILDEFDAVTTVFNDNLAAFQSLRTSINHPGQQVAIVTTSRRSIQEIELQVGMSTLAGVMTEIRLTRFQLEETHKLVALLQQIDLELLDYELESVCEITGNNPYLLSVLLFHIAALHLQGRQEDLVEQALKNASNTFQVYFDDLVNLLAKRDLLGLVKELGTRFSTSLSSTDLHWLQGYDLVSEVQPGRYKLFSPHFASHLRQVQWWGRQEVGLATDQLVDDRYRVLKSIKITGHSQVALAWDSEFERQVAIKCLHLDPRAPSSVDPQLLLNREARILAELDHPNVGRIYDYVRRPLGVVMQWIEGKSLYDIVVDGGKEFSATEILGIAIDLLDALDYIHTHPQRIIHRDIKPSNIIIRPSGEPVLIDFDIARARHLPTLMQRVDGTVHQIKTPRYAAPEQLLNETEIGPPADIFSLGVVLYELLAGVSPFDSGNNPEEYDPVGLPEIPRHINIPDDVFNLLLTMLRQKPVGRANARALRERFQICLAKIA